MAWREHKLSKVGLKGIGKKALIPLKMKRHWRIYHKANSLSAFKKYQINKENIMARKKEVISDSDEDIIYRLFYKFRNNTPKQILPISTRALGFIIRELAFKLDWSSVMPQHDTIYRLTNALYRISLLQLDLKLASAMEVVYPTNFCDDAFVDIKISALFVPAIKSLNIGFSPITDYINAIGFHKTKDLIYIPRHPRLNDTTECSPYFVNFGNLRKVVQLMADAKFNPEERLHFYYHCPIPGARWVFADSPILINADDVMPNQYGLRHLQDDIDFIVNCAEYIKRSIPRLIDMNGITWQKPGSISQIVFSNPLPVRCPSFDKKNLQQIIGSQNLFWATEKLSSNDFFKGIFYLLGEDAPLHLKDPKCVNYRDRDCAEVIESINYSILVACQIKEFAN